MKESAIASMRFPRRWLRTQKLKMNKTLDERTAIGTPRWRYQVANAGLFKYESRDRGIFEITAPQAAGDFKVLTPDGISL